LRIADCGLCPPKPGEGGLKHCGLRIDTLRIGR
jgi:hypothetical protein